MYTPDEEQCETDDGEREIVSSRGLNRQRGRGRGSRGRGQGRGRGRGRSQGRGVQTSGHEDSGNNKNLTILCLHCLLNPTDWLDSSTPVVVNPFTGSPGPKEEISNDPAEVFKLFFTDELLEQIVVETNRYAALCKGNDTTWRTNRTEIRAYFGFQIIMGISKRPEIRDFWSRDPRLHCDPITNHISRDRFEEITRFLHFVDNATLPQRGEDGYQRLQKVQPVIDSVRTQCLKVYEPRRENSIDEAMIPFKGKLNRDRMIS